MNRKQREAILWNLPRAPKPGEEDAIKQLEEDLSDSPVRGRALALRLKNFRPSASGYLASLGGPLPYMTRLRDIDEARQAHVERLADAHAALAEAFDDPVERDRQWREIVHAWSFDEINDLIDRHNRWYPVESRLAMDPRTGDYALVNGKDYRLEPLDAAWALARFPI